MKFPLLNSKQQIHSELIQPLIREPFLRERVAIKSVLEQLRGVPFREALRFWKSCARHFNFSQNLLNLFVLLPKSGFFFEDEIRPHATSRKIFHALIVLGSISVRIEMPRPLVTHVFQKLHNEK